MTATAERRSEPRQQVTGWAEIRQATTWGSWQVLDLSPSGLRAAGPIGIDPSRPVVMRLHVRGFSFEVDAASAWQDTSAMEPEHGWRFVGFGPEAQVRLQRALSSTPDDTGTLPLPASPRSWIGTWALAAAVALLGIVLASLVLL